MDDWMDGRVDETAAAASAAAGGHTHACARAEAMELSPERFAPFRRSGRHCICLRCGAPLVFRRRVDFGDSGIVTDARAPLVAP